MNKKPHRLYSAIIVPYGELSILPSIINSAWVLAENGYFVDVIAIASRRFDGVPEHNFNSDQIRTTFYEPKWDASLPAIGWYLRMEWIIALTRRICNFENYRCFFGVDADGLIARQLLDNNWMCLYFIILLRWS